MGKRIVIKGKVHGVGYRLFLYKLAESIEIDRFFADNIMIDSKEAVEVLVDDEKDKIDEFINTIKNKKPISAVVESIDIYDYRARIMKREAYYRYLTSMQLFKITSYGESMLDKRDETLNELRAFRSESKQNFDEIKHELGGIKNGVGDIKSGLNEINSKIRGLRQDLLAILDERLRRLEDDMRNVKSRLNID